MSELLWPRRSGKKLESELGRLLTGADERAWFVSPFATRDGLAAIEQAAEDELEVKLITRLNEADVLAGLLDLEALAELIEAGAAVRFHDDTLHAKLWIVDKTAVLGSANLTGRALTENVELMHRVSAKSDEDEPVVAFNRLWEALDGQSRTPAFLRRMEKRLRVHGERALFNRVRSTRGLKDYGGSSKSPHAAPTGGPKLRAWLKVNGEASYHIDENYDFRSRPMWDGGGQTVKRSGRPSARPGEIVILGHLGKRGGLNDLCIYGRGVVDVEHRRGIDEAPEWARSFVAPDFWTDQMKRWPYIFWLRDVQLVNGLAGSAPWVSDLADSPAAIRPESWRQQSHIQLDEVRLAACMELLDAAFQRQYPIEIAASESIWWNGEISDSANHITRSKLEALGA